MSQCQDSLTLEIKTRDVKVVNIIITTTTTTIIIIMLLPLPLVGMSTDHQSLPGH
jgi:hypothetical protein